jgi:hypothetical protein
LLVHIEGGVNLTCAKTLIFGSFSFIVFLSKLFFFLFAPFHFFCLVFYCLFSFFFYLVPPLFFIHVLSLFFCSCGFMSSLSQLAWDKRLGCWLVLILSILFKWCTWCCMLNALFEIYVVSSQVTKCLLTLSWPFHY